MKAAKTVVVAILVLAGHGPFLGDAAVQFKFSVVNALELARAA